MTDTPTINMVFSKTNGSSFLVHGFTERDIRAFAQQQHLPQDDVYEVQDDEIQYYCFAGRYILNENGENVDPF